MSTCKLKYAYNKLEEPNPVQDTKQYGLELFSTNGTSDVVFLNEFTWIGVAHEVSINQYNARFTQQYLKRMHFSVSLIDSLIFS